MNYAKQYIAVLAEKTKFNKDNLEKVLRLSEILRFLNSDSNIRGKLALKGGTAINFTMVNLPRLSVDIDLDFTKNLSNDEIEDAKMKLSKNITNYMWQKGYSLNVEQRRHYALLSFSFNYINNAGNNDHIKVEINFMDRCHIMPLEYKSVLSNGVFNSFQILTLNVTELYASKINALLSRAAPRDLYDVYSMIKHDILKNKILLKKCLIFYNMIGGEQDINNISFENIEGINFKKYKTQLKPVLAKSDSFNLDEAKTIVINYLKTLLIIDEDEQRFIDEFRSKNFKPDLLFKDESIINNIKSHPMALWRCR